MMMRITALVFVLVAAFGSYAQSHTGATGIVKERMDGMKQMGKLHKRVSSMFKGKTAFERAAVIEAADAFVLHGSGMAKLFPDTEKSRNGHKTEALPEIWQDWDDFQSRIADFVEKSEVLAAAARASADQRALKKPFSSAVESCSGCHKRYRKTKKR